MLVALVPGLALILICYASLTVRAQDSPAKPAESGAPATSERTPKVQDRQPGTLQQGADRVSQLEDGFVEQEALTFSGRGSLSLSQGDLIFIPEGKELDRVLGLHVVFDAQGRPSLTDMTGREEEFFDFIGQIDMRYDLIDESLQVLARSDDGKVLERRFDLFGARPESGRLISSHVQSYFTYMATGKDPVIQTNADDPPPPDTLNSCNCTTSSCSASQSCSNSQTCMCKCKGQSCRCWCSDSSD